MLLGAWGTKSGSRSSSGGGDGLLNPAIPVVQQPSSSSSNPIGRNGGRRSGVHLRFLALVTSFVLYLTLGAAIFSTIEAPAMKEIANNVDQLRGKFLARHPNVKGEFWGRGFRGEEEVFEGGVELCEYLLIYTISHQNKERARVIQYGLMNDRRVF